MNLSELKQLKKFGKARIGVGLAKYTTFKIGGPAEIFLEVADRNKLVELLNYLITTDLNYVILGGGSNVVFSDRGFEGVVIKNCTAAVKTGQNSIYADSGVAFGTISALAMKNRSAGLEWSAGLPGTVGGAIRGNAGASDGDTAKSLLNVDAWIDGVEVNLAPDKCQFGYRDSIFKHNGGVVLGGTFRLTAGTEAEIMKKIHKILEHRTGYYPPYPSAGSFFKNIPVKDWPAEAGELPAEFIASGKVPAGWINEQAGLKGLRVGGAMVSTLHGNFLINYQNATAEDLLGLIEEVKSRVYNKFKVNLEEEVQIIN